MSEPPPATRHRAAPRRSANPLRWPLYVRVLLGVVLGVLLGLQFGDRPYLGGWTNSDLGALGLLFIDLLKALAAPLIVLAILDAFLRIGIGRRDGLRLAAICLLNVAVAMSIGLAIAGTLRPGEAWRGIIADKIAAQKAAAAEEPTANVPAADKRADPREALDVVRRFVPDNLVEPFLEGNLLTLAVLAILAGAALRRVRDRQRQRGETSLETVERLIEAGFQIVMQMLEWVIQLLPFAVLAILAQVVGEHQEGGKADLLRSLWMFLRVTLLGLGLHALVYYPLAAWALGGRSPLRFLAAGFGPLVAGLSSNSSLITVPLTLRALTDRLGVSEQSARLSACVGTNFNNDGITLYEAMTALFVAQAAGLRLNVFEQFGVVLACIAVSFGAAGIPNAGAIILPLVLSAAGLPNEVIAAALPLILAVDWILARVRSAVNVLGDMQVAVLLDRSQTVAAPPPEPL